MEPQVDKTAYDFEKYTGRDRFASYFYQISEVLKSRPETVLEIGVGDGVLRDYLKKNGKIKYTSLDIATDLKPDVVGSVEKIPFPDQSFDSVCAFEILEHLPFDKFEMCLSEIARVSKKNIIISLPHFGPAIKFLLKIPFFKEFQFALKIKYPRVHVFNGQHYWEIGKRNYPLSKIVAVLEKKFLIKDEFVPYENQYHHFFILEKI